MGVPDLRENRDLDEALRLFRIAVEQHGADGPSVDEVRVPLRVFCERARRERVPPEELLICVKQALDRVMLLDPRHAATKEETRTRIVSLAIDAYFADGTPASPHA